MKKLLALLVLITLFSCNYTSISQDIMILQKKYPKATIYPMGEFKRYIICDSISVLDVGLKGNGTIFTIIKIK